MSVKATNYNGDKEYALAEMSDLSATNLLVNGDFLIWQRGDTLSLGATEYGPDMWRASTTCQLAKNEKGLKVVSGSNVTLTQYFTDTSYQGKQMTVIYSINGTQRYKTITANFVQGKLAIEITGLNTGNILNYVVLRVGEISSYVHASEEYAIAMIRCKRYVRTIRGTLFGNVYGTWEHIYIPVPISEMNSEPSVKVDTNTKLNEVIGKGVSVGTGLSIASGRVATNDRVLLVMTSGVFKNVTHSVVSLTLDGKPIVITCEPL